MLNNIHKRSFLLYYTACFLICYGLLFGSGSLLHQTAPLFAVNSLDLTLNLLILTGLADAVIAFPWLQALLDAVFLLMSLLLLWAAVKKSPYQYSLAFLNIIYNIVYSLLLCSLCSMSMQWFIGFIFIPALFLFKSDESYHYAFHSLRYLFILFFVSAGLWKIRAGGLFNMEQMSAILLKQHGPLLVSAPHSWYASVILKLVANPAYSYILYLLGTLAELSFLVGFFTKRWDKVLLLILVLFIVMDFVLMKINYFPWVAFGLLFWYSSGRVVIQKETNHLQAATHN